MKLRPIGEENSCSLEVIQNSCWEGGGNSKLKFEGRQHISRSEEGGMAFEVYSTD